MSDHPTPEPKGPRPMECWMKRIEEIRSYAVSMQPVEGWTRMVPESRARAAEEELERVRGLLREADPHLQLIEETSDTWTEKLIRELRGRISRAAHPTQGEEPHKPAQEKEP